MALHHAHLQPRPSRPQKLEKGKEKNTKIYCVSSTNYEKEKNSGSTLRSELRRVHWTVLRY